MTVEFSKPIDVWSRRKIPTNNDAHSRIEDVYVDFGTSLETTYDNPLKDRANRLLYRMRSDVSEGMEVGAVVGMGAGIGAGIATLLTFAITPNNTGIEGVAIAAGIDLGAKAAMAAGLGSGLRGRVLAVSGIAGVVAGGFVALSIESAADVVTGAVLSTGAATIAAVAAGIFMTVTSGVIARRNWPY